MSITRTLAAALAICALAAPVASAQPADMHASTAIAAAKEGQKQDLRSPDAREGREAAVRLHRSGIVVGTTSRPAAPQPAPVVPAAKSTGTDIDWATIALGVAGSLFAVLGVALVANRRRTPPLRPSA